MAARSSELDLDGVAVQLLVVELHLPLSHSLKDKRHVIRPVLERARLRFRVAASELAHQDLWQRATLGFVLVGSSASVVDDTVDQLAASLDDHDEAVVTGMERRWLS
jgi:uncharacterized protein